MKTKAVVISEPGKVGLQDVTLKAPGPDDIVVQTVYTSISAGTERMLLAGQMPHPMLALPVVPGYETVGRVVASGRNVPPGLNGQNVYIGGAHCFESLNAAWGGQSATLLTPFDRAVPLRNMEPRLGVMLALAATAMHGVDLLAVEPGDRVLVLGQGPVGQLAARIVRQRGGWVAVTDRNPSRLAHAAADLVINVTEASVADKLTEPVKSIIEATGSMTALDRSLPQLATGGTILLLGYYQRLALPYMPLFLKEARLLTAKEWLPGDLQRCRDAIASGELEVSSLLTHEMAINDVTTAYDVALNRLDCLKMVLDWTTLSSDK